MEDRPRKCQVDRGQAYADEQIGPIEWSEISNAHGPQKGKCPQRDCDSEQKEPTTTEIPDCSLVTSGRTNLGNERTAGSDDDRTSGAVTSRNSPNILPSRYRKVAGRIRTGIRHFR